MNFHVQCKAVFRFLGLIAVLTLPQISFATYLGPSAYLKSADSPFSSDKFSYFFLEDFEDGALNTPGVTSPSNFLVFAPAPLRDSVDADDGSIDGSGNAGHSLFSNGNKTLAFFFDAGVLDGLPTHVGLVWTDVGFSSDGLGLGNLTFQAFDAVNTSLGIYGPFFVGDGAFSGQTAEDRFFGVINVGGISKIQITMPGSGDWEADHLQYGQIAAGQHDGALAVGEPTTAILLVTGLLTLGIFTRLGGKS